MAALTKIFLEVAQQRGRIYNSPIDGGFSGFCDLAAKKGGIAVSTLQYVLPQEGAAAARFPPAHRASRTADRQRAAICMNFRFMGFSISPLRGAA